MAGLACRAARSFAQSSVQSSRTERRPDRHVHPSRLRRSSLFPARLFRLQDGPALRLREMHARRRRRGAAMPGLVEYPERGAAPGRARRHHRSRECRARGRSGTIVQSVRRPVPQARSAAGQCPAGCDPLARHRRAAGTRSAPAGYCDTGSAGSAPGWSCNTGSAGSETRTGTAATADRARTGLRLLSAISASPMAFIPAPGGCARSTTVPISTRCR